MHEHQLLGCLFAMPVIEAGCISSAPAVITLGPVICCSCHVALQVCHILSLNPVIVKLMTLGIQVFSSHVLDLTWCNDGTCMFGAGQEGFDYCIAGGYNGQFARCNVDRATQITIDVIVALAVLYFVVTCILLLSKLRSYRKLPYTFVQVGLVYNTLQANFLAPASVVRMASSLGCLCSCSWSATHAADLVSCGPCQHCAMCRDLRGS